VFYDFPVIALGSKHWHDSLGTQWDDVLLHNSLTLIGTNAAEQDVVFQRKRNGVLYGYRETVVRLRWLTPKTIFTEVAVADYAKNRTSRKSSTFKQEFHLYVVRLFVLAFNKIECLIECFSAAVLVTHAWHINELG
jgi:hypothetical protein